MPVIGGLIVGLMARYGSEKIRGHGIPEAIEAILFGKSRMSPKVAMLKPLSSGIVIGSGGPFGAEGPIIMTGGALGSLIAQCVHLTAAERKTLLVAGAAAGMTAVFGTPVAAVLLAVELLLFELRPRSLLPVALACAVAGFARAASSGTGPLFPLAHAPPGALVAGVLRDRGAAVRRAAVGAVDRALQGRRPVRQAADPLDVVARARRPGRRHRRLSRAARARRRLRRDRRPAAPAHRASQIALAILVVKAVIWVVALGSGTSGGVLAPLLMMGAGLGAVLGHVLPGGEPALWPLVCMAATLGGDAARAADRDRLRLRPHARQQRPAAAARRDARRATDSRVSSMQRSILTEKIARRGYHIYREYGVDPLERHLVDEVMSRDGRRRSTRDLTVRRGARNASSARRRRIAPIPVLRRGALIGHGRSRRCWNRDGLRASVVTRGRCVAPLFRLPSRCPARTAGSSRRGLRCTGSNGCRSSRTPKRCARRHRVAQRSGQAVARPFRRGAQARAVPAHWTWRRIGVCEAQTRREPVGERRFPPLALPRAGRAQRLLPLTPQHQNRAPDDSPPLALRPAGAQSVQPFRAISPSGDYSQFQPEPAGRLHSLSFAKD